MSGYFINDAQSARLGASLTAISMFVEQLQDQAYTDFNPDNFLAMLKNVEGETLFLNQYVVSEFLVDEDKTSDGEKPSLDPDNLPDGYFVD